MKRISAAQEKALLRKHVTGDFGTHQWKTIEALIAGGYLKENPRGLLEVTPKGKAYCDEHHLDIPPERS